MAIETVNKFGVGVGQHPKTGEFGVSIMLLPKGIIRKTDALLLAAWLVALADDHDEFPAILKAVQNA
jgi:hypothetical protein